MPKANKYNKSYGLSNPLQDIFPEPIVAQRSPTTNDVGYRIGQSWVDQTTNQIYGLASVVAGSATWSIMGPGSSDVDTLTGDSGGAISPAAGNINILGGDGLTVVGSGSTLTINRDAEGGYPVTPYVVGSAGEAGYTTIQSALDAANAAGGGIVYVQPGNYTENLTGYDNCPVVGLTNSLEGNLVTLTGVHTPPNSGTWGFDRVALNSSTDIFNSSAAGTALLYINNLAVNVTNGYIFNVPNWTGDLNGNDIGDAGSTNNGAVNNTGGSTVFFNNGVFGMGTGNTMTVSGALTRLDLTEIGCPLNVTAGFLDVNLGFFLNTVTVSGSTEAIIFDALFSTVGQPCLTWNTSGSGDMFETILDSNNNPCVSGTGAGTLTVSNITFSDNANFAATLTIAGGNSTSGSFSTSDQAAGLTISGNDIDADGSDANISITVSPKGTGDFIVDVGDIQDTAGDIIATRSSAGGDVTVEATNSDNTNPASRGGFEAAVGGTSAGDPYVNFLISGGQTFTMGIDNSTTNDDFVISDSNALGTTNRISIDGSSGVVTTVSGLTSTGTTTILDSVNANTAINTGTSTGTVSIGNSAAGAITVDTAAGISLDAATASNFTVTGAADLSVSSSAGSVVVTGGEAAADAIQLTASNAAGGLDLNAGTGGVAIDTTGAFSLDGATASNVTSSLAASAAAVTISASAADGGITMDAGATPGVTFTNGTQSHQMLVGSGSPNGSITASQGSLYVDVAGSTSTTILFVNTDGSTTWVGVGA